MRRPLSELIGQVSSENFDALKQQAATHLVGLARSPELSGSVLTYLRDALAGLQPQCLRVLLEILNPDSAARLKTFLTKSLLTVLARDHTAPPSNGLLS